MAHLSGADLGLIGLVNDDEIVGRIDNDELSLVPVGEISSGMQVQDGDAPVGKAGPPKIAVARIKNVPDAVVALSLPTTAGTISWLRQRPWRR